MIEEIKGLIETLNNIIENNMSDEDLKSDLDMLVNADSSTDLSLTTLLKHVENHTALEEAFSYVFRI